MTSSNLLTVELHHEEDIVSTRQRLRQIAALVGLTAHEQTSFATAVSEIARNAYRYGGGGKVEFSLENTADRPMLMARVRDSGPGIANIKQILDGQYRSQAGMGLGIIGSQRLSDIFDIQSGVQGGTVVTLGKRLPKQTALTNENIAKFASDLAQRSPASPVEEVQQQNRELLVAMADLQKRQSEVEHLNAELAETNRGVLALYAELDDRAMSLSQASEAKSRFLSDMSHELRTPLNAMISLSGLLLDRVDGELSEEQEKQVMLIRRSAETLRDMVSDLLDLAKIEAGRTNLHPSDFVVADLLVALRGLFRPLFSSDKDVVLIIEDAVGMPPLHTDEQKVSQILRNFVSNSLKFTLRGEVRVSCKSNGDGTITISVADTGIGIAQKDLQLIFEDFSQVDSYLQRGLRGTGLGLPLSRKLARLLGGEVTVSSEPGVGSRFNLTIPIHCPRPEAHSGDGEASRLAVETESAFHA